MKNIYSSIESLETRIAPAGITFFYVDADGDNVTVKISKGTPGDAIFTTIPSGAGKQLLKIDLQGNPVFQGADISVTALASNGVGNGRANVGYLKAMGVDLKSVKIAGDLGRIEAGDSALNTPGLGLLDVKAFGTVSLESTGVDPATGVLDTVSHVKGALTTMKVATDFANRGLVVDFLGTATITGSLIGQMDNSNLSGVDNSGQIYSNGNIGTVTVKGDIRGGVGVGAGSIISKTGSITKVTVGGAIIGGSGSSFAGAIFANNSIGTVKVTGDVRGGTGAQSGYIAAGGAGIASASVGGSLKGGTANNTGEIAAFGTIKKVIVTGAIVGGNNSGKALTETGYIEGDRILSATVGGITAGTDDGSGLTKSGSIRAVDDIGTLMVKGDLIGNATNKVYIAAFGAPAQTTTDLAIRTVTITGSVLYSEILAGYDLDTTDSPRGPGLNGDAQIGKVTVNGDWSASSLIAGVGPTDSMFGNANDAALTGTSSSIVSSIATVIIKGQVSGTADSADSATFGIAAQKLGTVKIGGVTLPLIAGPSNDTFAAGKAKPSGSTLGTTNADGFDFHIYEVV